jgi:hypothetical protein
MHLELFVEEPSAEFALRALVPRIGGPDLTFEVYPFQGKANLLANLPSRLRAYARWIPPDWRILVLLDADLQDCRVIKKEMDDIARSAGLRIKADTGEWREAQVLNRIAIEELEAWFLGDVEALCTAYPKVPASLAQKKTYRDPDAIRGTWETLEMVLQRAGYHAGGLSKIKAAREISIHMDPARNRSRSFQAFRDGLLALVTG